MFRQTPHPWETDLTPGKAKSANPPETRTEKPRARRPQTSGRGGFSELRGRSASGTAERATDDRTGRSDFRFDPIRDPIECRPGRAFENRSLVAGVADDALVRVFMLRVRDGFDCAEQQQRRKQNPGQPAEEDARPIHESQRV